MSTALATNGHYRAEAFEAALVGGDLSKLTTDERVHYYNRTCESLGLNPLTKPFSYLNLNGKLVLYALRDCTEQLRKIHRVSITIVSRDMLADDIYVVTARATLPDGRTDESTGVVSLAGLKGENRSNALMKAETKSKRRVTLSICGLGILDESEVSSIPNAAPIVDLTVPGPIQAKIETAPANDVRTTAEWVACFEGATSIDEIEEMRTACKAQVKDQSALLEISTAYANAKKRLA
jgi:hypothetical protein